MDESFDESVGIAALELGKCLLRTTARYFVSLHVVETLMNAYRLVVLCW